MLNAHPRTDLLFFQPVGSRVFPIVSFPPSALSVGDAEFLSSFKDRVSFLAFSEIYYHI